ncbi:DUF2690 domain-containing protein [Micromonospora purpureochromogenes]|uniref:DUF2690 domain-containing protein n=1 Tax=Micromonospora purpureochromogenes TaxID=47872 RepID=UPI00341073A5
MNLSQGTRRVAAALAALVLGTVVAVAAQEPAHAAGCYRNTCNGQDPQAKGCANDARNLESFWYQGASPWLQNTLLELRYSPACDAAWVRTTGGDCLSSWRPCVSALQVSGGSEQWGGPSGGQKWTNMWSFRYLVRGCFRSGDDLHLDGCTAWR